MCLEAPSGNAAKLKGALLSWSSSFTEDDCANAHGSDVPWFPQLMV